jgi:hypothetical protein
VGRIPTRRLNDAPVSSLHAERARPDHGLASPSKALDEITLSEGAEMHRFSVFVSAALLCLAAAPASAQQSGPLPVEFGVDAAVTFFTDPNFTVVSLPLREVRLGFFATPSVELEPRLGLVSSSGGGTHSTDLEFGFGLLYHFTPSRAEAQPYVRPFVQVESRSSSGSRSATATTLGVGLGAKLPIHPRFSIRPEINFGHTFENDLVGAGNTIQLLLGVSAFSR